jgi:hypothetical protein
MLVATDIRQLTPFMKEVLLSKEMLAIHQDPAAKPGGRIGYAECFPGECRVSLGKQLSRSKCQYGSSFGCSSASSNQSTPSMWTDHGCSGVFTCNGEQVTCSSHNHARAACQCGGGGGGGSSSRDVLRPASSDPSNAVTPSSPTKCEIWARELADGGIAVGLYNSDSVPRNITANISLVWKGFSGAAAADSNTTSTAQVRDVWQQRDLGVFSGTFTADAIPPHGTSLLKFSKAGGSAMVESA